MAEVKKLNYDEVKAMYTSPFDDVLCPLCRTLHKSHLILSKNTLVCMNPTCGVHFTPKLKLEKFNEILRRVTWKRT